MRRLYLFFSFTLVMILVISCNNNFPKNNQAEKLDATRTPLPVSSTLIVPENTALVATTVCPKVANDIPQNIMSGVIVVWDLSGNEKKAYLWNVEADIKTDLPGEADRSFPPDPMVSPDRKWLAYFEYLKNEENTLGPVRLSVANSKGEMIMSTENTWKNWTGLIGWLDKSHLMMDQLAQESPHPTFILNPFTGETNTIVADYPDIYKSPQHYMGWWDSFATSMTVYDPGISLVIYPLSPSEIVLFDVEKKQKLARIDIGNPTGSAPQWSPDYQEFVVDVSKRGNDPYDAYYSEEIYIVDRGGKIIKLTDFASTSSTVDIQEYRWSPDGRYLAFWYSINPKEKKYELATLNIETKKLTTYCVTDYIRTGALHVIAPVWSPDGKQLIVRGRFNDENSKRTDKDSIVILVDTSRYIVSQIAENAIPLGWMISSQ